jgi:putative transposase
MKRSRFTEAQIVSILREYDAGTPIAELARKHAVHANTLRLWKSKYGGLDVSDLMRLKELEDENTRMRRVIANLTLENDAMKELASKNSWSLHGAKKR